MKRIVLLLLGLLLALPQFAQERKYTIPIHLFSNLHSFLLENASILLFMSRERLCLKNFRLLQKILFF